MDEQSRLQTAHTGQLRWRAALAALVVAIFALLLLSDLSAETRRVVTGVGLVGGGVAAGASFRVRAIATSGRRRRAWTLFAWASGFAALSNVFSLVLTADTTGSSLPSTLSLVACLVLGVFGVAQFPIAARRGTDVTRMVLDGIVIGGSVLFIVSVTLFPHVLDTRGSSGALILVVPVTDVVIATLATLLFLRSGGNDLPLGLGAVGFSVYAVSDFCYAVIVGNQGRFEFGSILDIGWIAGYAVIAVAATTPSRTTENPDRPVEASPVLSTVLIFGLFIVAAGLSLFGLQRGTLTDPSAVLWSLVLLAVLARQFLLIVDNERLRRILEQRVIERSRSLLQANHQTDLLVNSVGDGIYGVDRDGLITFVNPAAAQALGYAAATLIGQEAHATFHERGSNGVPYPVDSCYITEAIRDDVVANAEEDTYVRADGRVFPVEVTATPLSGTGDTAGAVVVFRDVTQRREVDRMKSEFVSMVSHELRTPLTAIRGSLGLISGGALGPVTPAAARMVEIALVSSERLTRLINEILDIERIESGVLPMDLMEHSAADLVDAAVGQVLILAEQASVRVEVNAVDGEVFTDSDRVVQTLLNLVGNAIKFSAPGDVVTIGSVQRDSFVEFTISDRGRGIPEDKLDRIFGRFEQVDSSDAREKGGSGLGLAISRSIIERLGGRIWAANNPVGGATFSFTLPVPQPLAERALGGAAVV